MFRPRYQTNNSNDSADATVSPSYGEFLGCQPLPIKSVANFVKVFFQPENKYFRFSDFYPSEKMSSLAQRKFQNNGGEIIESFSLVCFFV